MIRTATAVAAGLGLSFGTALAAAPTIPAGDYLVSTQIQKITNDTTGICSQLLKVGEVQVGEGQNLGLGKTSQVITPVPTAAAPYTLGIQVCNYSKSPSSLNASGSTPAPGTTTCSLNGTTYTLKTTAANGSILPVVGTSNNAYYLNATSSVSVNGTTLCTITTSTLNLFTGLKHS